jgi:hypothetical protein
MEVSLQEMARTMLNDSKLSDIFLGTSSAYNHSYLEQGLIRSNSDKTPYELWKGRSTNVKHFRVFGSKCYIKREDKKIGKFDSQVDEGIFVGYSCKNKSI